MDGLNSTNRTGWPRWLETLAAFALGAALMTFAYRGGAKPTSEIGVPGHDSYYHIKMAAMLPDIGLVREFPWLRFCYFTDEGQAFVSHHYGFHVFMAPFVQFSKRITGDYLAGGRWANIFAFGLVVALFHGLLIASRVPWPWLWMFLFLLMPYQFFTRHALVRAMTPSLVCMLGLLWLMFRNRWILVGILTAFHIHLYLGGVIYAPLVVGLFVISQWLVVPRGFRLSLPILFCGVAGWIIGIVTHPYSGGIFEFLRLQIFGSGLSPDIAVGQEWNPYENLWWFANMSGVLLTVWIVAIVARLRHGAPLNAEELSLFLINVAFLVLTFKARRFVEYWPIFCLLSSAYLIAPVIRKLLSRDPLPNTPEGQTVVRNGLSPAARFGIASGVLILLIAFGMFGPLWIAMTRELAEAIRWWPVWSAVAAIYAIARIAHAWRECRQRAAHPPATWTWWKVFAIDCQGVVTYAAAFFVGAVFLASPTWAMICKDAKSVYDLPAIRDMMGFVEKNSQPGDVIFTDDWDIFPVYFYYNTHNHYIVGLDPKFTHQRQPELWDRYVKISRGQVPADIQVKPREKGKEPEKSSVHVRLEDIRDEFGAKFVIVDKDHRALADKLAAAAHFAELVYPTTVYKRAKDAPYLVFRIREASEQPIAQKHGMNEIESSIVLQLSAIRPTSVQQGWGDLMFDQSVEGNPLSLGKRVYAKGFGTHAPSKIEFRLPDGFDWFEADVGIDTETNGLGSAVVAIFVDDTVVLTTPVLTGDGEAYPMRVRITDARRLTLQTDPTSDGNHLDHVNFADARLLRERPSQKE